MTPPRTPAPLRVSHAGVRLNTAETAWARRDAAEAALPAEAVPPPPPDSEGRSGGGAAEAGGAEAGAAGGATAVEAGGGSSLFELQRSLTHAQMSRPWSNMGQSEAQLETGTSTHALEQVQRAVELLARRKQLAELELCEELVDAAAMHAPSEGGAGAGGAAGAGGVGGAAEEGKALARAAYERVLRLEEWGIAESSAAGDQRDNAEETLRRWWGVKVHASFRLLCLHHNAGRRDEADKISAFLHKVEDEFLEDAQLKAERRNGSANLAHQDVISSLDALDAAVAAAGALPVDEREQLRRHGLLPPDEWAERLQRSMAAAQTAALAKLRSEAPAADAGAPPVAEAAAEAEAGAAEVGRARRRGAHHRVAMRGPTEREWLARQAKYARCGEESGDARLAAARLQVEVQDEAADNVLRAEHAQLRSLQKARAAADIAEGPGAAAGPAAGVAAEAEQEAPPAEANGEAEAVVERPEDVLSLYVVAVRHMSEERRKGALATVAELEAEAARDQLEGFKKARQVEALQQTEAGSAGPSDGAPAPAASLPKLLASIEAKTAECWRLEAEVADLYRQRLAQLRREKAALSVPDPEPTWGIGGGPFDSVPSRLRRLLGTRNATPPESARHHCAVNMAIEAALQLWIRQRQQVSLQMNGSAAPPVHVLVERMLFGTTPAQMENKLDAVRHCADAAGLQTAEGLTGVARWLLRCLPECVAVPCGNASAEESRYRLSDGSGVEVVSEVLDEKPTIWDGQVLAAGELDGETSGASYEPGPWQWCATDRVWRRDQHPHDVLVQVPCGHCYSEEFWRLKLSTAIDHVGGAAVGARAAWRARKARCCAPLPSGEPCGAVLMQNKGLRVTRCNPPHAAELRAVAADDGDGGELRQVEQVPIYGYWGSRVEQAVRLLQRLRALDASPRQASDPQGEAAAQAHAAGKAVVYTRLDQTARLLQAACLMNGVRCVVPSGGGADAQQKIAAFQEQAELQVLLLSAQAYAAGLTLTCARHVVILEPQLDLATELQMIGRVHRIGQTRQTYVHRLCVDGSFEHSLAAERLTRAVPDEATASVE